MATDQNSTLSNEKSIFDIALYGNILFVLWTTKKAGQWYK